MPAHVPSWVQTQDIIKNYTRAAQERNYSLQPVLKGHGNGGCSVVCAAGSEMWGSMLSVGWSWASILPDLTQVHTVLPETHGMECSLQLYAGVRQLDVLVWFLACISALNPVNTSSIKVARILLFSYRFLSFIRVYVPDSSLVVRLLLATGLCKTWTWQFLSPISGYTTGTAPGDNAMPGKTSCLGALWLCHILHGCRRRCGVENWAAV